MFEARAAGTRVRRAMCAAVTPPNARLRRACARLVLLSVLLLALGRGLRQRRLAGTTARAADTPSSTTSADTATHRDAAAPGDSKDTERQAGDPEAGRLAAATRWSRRTSSRARAAPRRTATR